jgi:hypothetical protein
MQNKHKTDVIDLEHFTVIAILSKYVFFSFDFAARMVEISNLNGFFPP